MARSGKSTLRTGSTSIPFFDYSNGSILNKTVTVYGRTNSGKTTIIKDLVYSIKSKIATVFIFGSPSVVSSYSDFVHKRAIYHSISIDMLKNMVTRQEQVTLLWKDAKNPEYMKKLFFKVATMDDRACYHRICKKYDRAIALCEKQQGD